MSIVSQASIVVAALATLGAARHGVAAQARSRAVGPYVSVAAGVGLLNRGSRPLTPTDVNNDPSFDGGVQNPNGMLDGLSFSGGAGLHFGSVSVGVEYTRWEQEDEGGIGGEQTWTSVLIGPTWRFGPAGAFLGHGGIGVVNGTVQREVGRSGGGEGWYEYTNTRASAFAVRVGIGFERMLGARVGVQAMAEWTLTRLSDPSDFKVNYHYGVVRAGVVLVPWGIGRRAT